MTEYANGSFYENLQEASRRLLNTVVTYDGEPCTVITIANHKPDGIFRVYLSPIANPAPLPHSFHDWGPGSNQAAQVLDDWLGKAENKDKMLRKHINSPAFNRFRPFPLGMMNYKGTVYYMERQPIRHVEQGLTRNGLMCHTIRLTKSGKDAKPWGGAITGPEMRDCIVGTHPEFAKCLKNMRDPNVTNEAVAFHREFALIRGPVDTLFLVYKTEAIGVVDTSNTSVTLGRSYRHYREVVDETKAFTTIRVQS